MTPLLDARNISKQFSGVPVLKGIDFTLLAGQVHALMGGNGAGKSTLMKIIAGVETPDGGELSVEGQSYARLTPAQAHGLGIYLVPQEPLLFPNLTVRENIVLPIQLDGGKVDERYVGEVVTALGLEKKLNSLPGQLSGGQQQRVAIARALATKPAILLADEPTGNLDSRTSQDVLSLMKVTGRKFSQTMVMITHNEEIAQLSDRIVRIEDGRIVTQ